MSRWQLQFQPEQTRHMLASRWSLHMALKSVRSCDNR